MMDSSGDGTARIWDLTSQEEPSSVVLTHVPKDAANRDVCTVDWHPHGHVLATGSYEGIARIWTKNGEFFYKILNNFKKRFGIRTSKKKETQTPSYHLQ